MKALAGTAAVLAAALTAAALALTVPASAGAGSPVTQATPTPTPTLPAPIDPCPTANVVCLFDSVGLAGQQINVRPAERGGCIDLGVYGWAGRALSASNKFAREAVYYPNRDCTGRPDGIPGNTERGTLLFSPGSIWVFDACSFTGVLCLYERVDFNGAEFNVRALNPATGTCVNLVTHGWGGRAASAVNTNTRFATLYSGPDCSGSTLNVGANSWDRALAFAPNSVFVF
jgi:hypothetical protein